jgi:hypothetical protein
LSFANPAVAGPLEDANAALKRRDYATAVLLNRPLAEQGDANAQYNLGTFYDNGLGVPLDKVRAYMWFSSAPFVAPLLTLVGKWHDGTAAETLLTATSAQTLAGLRTKARSLPAKQPLAR